MSSLRRALSVVDALTRAGEHLAALILYGMAALMLIEAAARGLFRSSLSFSWEYAAYAMAAAFSAAAAGALNARSHVRVAALLGAFGSAAGRRVDLLATALGLAVALLMTYSLGLLFLTSLMRGQLSATVTRTPLALPQGLALAGLALFCLALAARFVRLWCRDAPEPAPAFSTDEP